MKRLLLTLFLSALALAGCNRGIDDTPAPTPSQNGVVINGVTWARSNVNVPGTFAAAPESYGMFYQWNRTTAWLSTGANPVSAPAGMTWDSSAPTGDVWAAANDPCPEGWHVPTAAQLATLVDASKVSYAWTTQNGVNGGKFTDIASGNSIFLPAAGGRGYSDGALYDAGNGGKYWSGSSDDSTAGAWGLSFFSDSAGQSYYYRALSLAVRCVGQ